MYSRVLGTGSALPKRIVTNGEFAAMLARDGIETSDEWIRTRTGIESRHFADEAEGETTSSLAVAAARRALEAANVETSEIDLIIVATTTPDMVFPSVACRVQAALGARGCAAFDVQAVCAGFIYALNAADDEHPLAAQIERGTTLVAVPAATGPAGISRHARQVPLLKASPSLLEQRIDQFAAGPRNAASTNASASRRFSFSASSSGPLISHSAVDASYMASSSAFRRLRSSRSAAFS